MSINKINLPVDGTNIMPNPNNLTGEAKQYQELCYKFPRTSEGQIVFTASPSGIVYKTEDYPTDPNIYNKGEDGMMNLLFKLYSGDGGFIVTVADFSGGGGGYQGEFTYQELKDLISSNSLVVGGLYVISDYQTKYLQPWTSVIKQSNEIEKLLLKAISVSSFDYVCGSVNYPNDTVYYNFNMNICEDNITPRNGFITRRIDNFYNIDYPEDWRNIVYARWSIDNQYYKLNSVNTLYSTWSSGTPVTAGRLYKDNLGNINICYVSGNATSDSDSNFFALIGRALGENPIMVYPDNTDSYQICVDPSVDGGFTANTIELLRDKITPPKDYYIFRKESKNRNIYYTKSSYSADTLTNNVFLNTCIEFKASNLKNSTFCWTLYNCNIAGSSFYNRSSFYSGGGETRNLDVNSDGLENVFITGGINNVYIRNSNLIFLIGCRNVSIEDSFSISCIKDSNCDIENCNGINFRANTQNINVKNLKAQFGKYFNLFGVPNINGYPQINITTRSDGYPTYYYINLAGTAFTFGDVPQPR